MSILFTTECRSAGALLLQDRAQPVDAVRLLTALRGAGDHDAVIVFLDAFDTSTWASCSNFVPPAQLGDEPTFNAWCHVPQTLRPSRTVFIQDFGRPDLKLARAIPVSVDFWPNHVTACSYDIEEFGVGNDEFAAVENLKEALADLYLLLKADQERLGPLPQRQWRYLKDIIREA
jgi:hypothetical protein